MSKHNKKFTYRYLSSDKKSKEKPSKPCKDELQRAKEEFELSEEKLIKKQFRAKAKAVTLRKCAEEVPIQTEILLIQSADTLDNLVSQDQSKKELLEKEAELADKEAEKFEELRNLKHAMKEQLDAVRKKRKKSHQKQQEEHSE